jgi:hypothetical protein
MAASLVDPVVGADASHCSDVVKGMVVDQEISR